jgi:hypothetical protein
MWADCLDNVRSSTSHNPIGLHGLITGIALCQCLIDDTFIITRVDHEFKWPSTTNWTSSRCFKALLSFCADFVNVRISRANSGSWFYGFPCHWNLGHRISFRSLFGRLQVRNILGTLICSCAKQWQVSLLYSIQKNRIEANCTGEMLKGVWQEPADLFIVLLLFCSS